MSEVNKFRKIDFTILKVDSIPCDIVGNKMTFSYDGSRISEPWVLKWPMPWIEEEFTKVVLNYDPVSKKENKKIYNPEETDQYVEVLIRSYIDLTVPKLVDYTVERFAEREALVDKTGSIRYKYKDFKKIINNLAKGLIEIGVKKGDNVTVWAVNSPEAVIAQFGISKTGGVFVPLNAYEKQIRMEELLRQSDTNTLIMQVGTKGTEGIELIYDICPELRDSAPGKLQSKRFPKLKNVIVLSDDEYPGTYKWSEILMMGEGLSDDLLYERQNLIDIDDVVQMIYTSGSTGSPKGVMLSHYNIIENAKAMADLMELTEEDIMCILSPLFHCFGSIACTLSSVVSGCSMVIVNKFNTEATLSLIEREKCTVLSGVPTLFVSCIDLLEHKHYDVSTLRTGIIAGASCPCELIEQIKNVMGMKNILPAYGLTECSPCVSVLKGCNEQSRGTAGSLLPGVEVKIIDLNSSQELEAGQDGEILVKGYNVMEGYYKMPDETKKVFNEDGWLRTGDIGCITKDGYLCIRGRCKDIIIKCGENISPKEIEDYLITHSEVAEVNVVSVPDSLSGEEIVAFVRLKDDSNLTEGELRRFCKGKLASIKIPKYIKIIKEFPLSGTGKVLKKDLRKMALEMIKDINNECCNA